MLGTACVSLAASEVEKIVVDEVMLLLGGSTGISRPTALRYIRGFPGKNGAPDAAAASAALQASCTWRLDAMHPDGSPRACGACALDNESHCIVPLGRTALGSPLLYMSAPRARNLNTKDCVDHLIEALERSFSFPQNDEIPETGVWVFDGRGYTLLAGAMNPNLGIAYARTLQNHFPERLGKCLLVDVNWAFSTFWALVRPFVAPATAAKIVQISGREALVSALDELQVSRQQKAWVLEAYDMEPLPGNLPAVPLPDDAPKMATQLPRASPRADVEKSDADN